MSFEPLVHITVIQRSIARNGLNNWQSNFGRSESQPSGKFECRLNEVMMQQSGLTFQV